MVGGGEWVGNGISCQWVGWCGWMMGCWRERGPAFILKGEVFFMVWTPTEAFMLVVVWTMSSDWSGYEGWTMYPDLSELNHALWLVRTWWLKMCELNRELWLVRTWWLRISELNRDLWLVRTWGLRISELNHEFWLVRTLLSESCKLIGQD